ncbi:hypothetical protein INR49_006089 [Caranx melampygus]|nr:hypothetical protein INR49_006089 [Caranx melampygus]
MEDEDEQELLDPRTASLYASENCSVINHRLLLEEILKVLLDILPDVETSGAPNDADTKCDTCKVIKDLLDVFSSLYSPSHQVSRDIDTSSLSVKLPYNHCEDKISSDAENSSPRVKTEQAENQADSLDDFIFSNTSQLILDSEEEGSSRKAPLANSSFITQELRCEAEKAHVDTIKEEEDLLIKRQWKEWMDKQEMGGNSAKTSTSVLHQQVALSPFQALAKSSSTVCGRSASESVERLHEMPHDPDLAQSLNVQSSIMANKCKLTLSLLDIFQIRRPVTTKILSSIIWRVCKWSWLPTKSCSEACTEYFEGFDTTKALCTFGQAFENAEEKLTKYISDGQPATEFPQEVRVTPR